jgi:hypothetical protein
LFFSERSSPILHVQSLHSINRAGVAALANLAYHCRANQDKLGAGYALGETVDGSADGSADGLAVGATYDAATAIAQAMQRRPQHREIQVGRN